MDGYLFSLNWKQSTECQFRGIVEELGRAHIDNVQRVE